MSTPLNTVGGRFRPYLKTALTATGTNQATAYPLVNNAIHEFTTVTSSTGAVLPIPEISTQITITNAGGSSLTVYPPLGGTITNGTVNAGVALTSGSSITYYANSLTNWYALNAAVASGGSGTVTNVTFTGDGVTSSTTPSAAVSTTGTLTQAVATAAKNTVVAGPVSGSNAALAQRALVAADLPTIAANTFSGNQTSGSAAPVALTNLTANTDGSITFTGVSHSAPAAGDLWFPSGDQGTFAIGRSSGPARLGGCIFSCLGCTPVANTGAATSIFGSPTSAVGSLTIPANTLVAGNVLRWNLDAKYSCVATVTISFQILLNGSVILQSLATQSLAISVTNFPMYNTSGFIPILAAGSSAVGGGSGSVQIVQASATLLTATMTPGGATPVANSSFASNAGTLFDFKVTWGTAAVGNTFAVQSFNLYLDN